MKKFFAIMSLLSFMALLDASSAIASDYVTACLKQKKDGSAKKNTKLNRVAKGTDPGSSCKNKQIEVTLPTDQITDDLQEQIAANDADILALQEKTTANMNAIMSNDEDIAALQEKTTTNMDLIMENSTAIEANTIAIAEVDSKAQENMDDIMDLNEQVNAIATVIGGGTGTTELSNTDDTQFMGMFFSRTSDSDLAAENRIPLSGTLTNFWARQTGDTTGDAQRLYTVLLRSAPNPATATALNCIIGEGEHVCADDANCVDVVANQRISVEVDSSAGSGTLPLSRANWSAKFTPGVICPVAP